jgi:hypothetical protein
MAGCGNNEDHSTPDLQSTPDLATAAGPQQDKLGCQGIAYCAVSCNGDLSCDTGCYNRGTAKAQALTNQLVACVAAVCTSAPGGLGRCTAYPGDTSTDCTACAYNAVAGWAGGAACAPASDSACNRCGMQSAACLSDL